MWPAALNEFDIPVLNQELIERFFHEKEFASKKVFRLYAQQCSRVDGVCYFHSFVRYSRSNKNLLTRLLNTQNTHLKNL